MSCHFQLVTNKVSNTISGITENNKSVIADPLLKIYNIEIYIHIFYAYYRPFLNLTFEWRGNTGVCKLHNP